jgi:hypothetical protein
MKHILMLTVLMGLSACGAGNTYQDHFDKNKAKGMSFQEALVATDAHCLNNPCDWR